MGSLRIGAVDWKIMMSKRLVDYYGAVLSSSALELYCLDSNMVVAEFGAS